MAKTGMICWVPDKTNPAKFVGLDITPAVTSVKAFIDTQTVPPDEGQTPPVPMYNGPGDLFLSEIRQLLERIVDIHPTPEIATAKAEVAAKEAIVKTAKGQLIDRVKSEEPK